MTSITFDTLRYMKTLEGAGVPRPQAEAQARAQQESITEIMEAGAQGVATKADIGDLRREISEVKTDIIKWVFGISLAQGAMILAVLRIHG